MHACSTHSQPRDQPTPSDRQPMGESDFPIIVQTNELDFNSITGLICPNSHLTHTGNGSFIMDGVCTFPRPPEESAKQFAVTLS